MGTEAGILKFILSESHLFAIEYGFLSEWQNKQTNKKSDVWDK